MGFMHSIAMVLESRTYYRHGCNKEGLQEGLGYSLASSNGLPLWLSGAKPLLHGCLRVGCAHVFLHRQYCCTALLLVQQTVSGCSAVVPFARLGGIQWGMLQAYAANGRRTAPRTAWN